MPNDLLVPESEVASRATMAQSGAPAARTRRLVAGLFGATVLAFLLPFGTVSCGTPVTFTGLELATANVHGDDPEVVEEANGGDAPFFAALAGLAAIAGLALALAGLRGAGWAGLVGLLGLAILPSFAVLAQLTVRVGYVLAFGALAAVVGIRARELLRRRRGAGRRTWPAVAGLSLLVLFLSFSVLLCIGASQESGGY